ncbi:uncharacterized protein LOC127631970 [Xyrauchen texanus]|uniref:uncharacterized protein LOC127631970 n=1 Tax=Xyrauchen texanus TaxID=154827 RepID=UPI00224201C4|nr:uncharacterized protein LOC127631970 [Xyrauchen texanus]
MVFTVSLRSLLLVCLLPLCIQSVDETADPQTLMRIVEMFETRLNVKGQYAVAIRLEKEECLPKADLNSMVFDRKKLQEIGVDILNGEISVSDDIIAAKYKQFDKYTDHSEFRLKNYLNKVLAKEDQCVIYFSLNSPCLNKCLNGKYNIENSLKALQSYTGIKAFLFKYVYEGDDKQTMVERMKAIAPNLPLFQCRYTIEQPTCVQLLKGST